MRKILVATLLTVFVATPAAARSMVQTAQQLMAAKKWYNQLTPMQKARVNRQIRQQRRVNRR